MPTASTSTLRVTTAPPTFSRIKTLACADGVRAKVVRGRSGLGGQLGYLNGENVDVQDDVFWYVAHRNHVPTIIEFFGGGSYKWMGPILKAKNP